MIPPFRGDLPARSARLVSPGPTSCARPGGSVGGVRAARLGAGVPHAPGGLGSERDPHSYSVTVTLPQHPHQILGPQMRIPLEHLQGLVPRDRRHLHLIQSLLEQA